MAELTDLTAEQVKDWMENTLELGADVLQKFEGLTGAVLQLITEEEWREEFKDTKATRLKVTLSWRAFEVKRGSTAAAAAAAAATAKVAAVATTNCTTNSAAALPVATPSDCVASNGAAGSSTMQHNVNNINVGHSHGDTADEAEEDIDTDAMDNDTYEPEGILAHRNNPIGILEYEVKWKGYPSSSNTWEPEGNLTGSKGLIADYFGDRTKGSYKTKNEKKKKRQQHQKQGAAAAKRSKTAGGIGDGDGAGAAADPPRAPVTYPRGPTSGKLMEGLFAHNFTQIENFPGLKVLLEGSGDNREEGLLYKEFNHNYTVKGRFLKDGSSCGPIVYTAGESRSAVVGIVALAGGKHLNTLLVLPSFRRKGYGKRIVQHVVDFARESGKKEVKIMCTPEAVAGVNEGVRGATEPFWKACGFNRTKTQDPGLLKKEDAKSRRCKMKYVIDA